MIVGTAGHIDHGKTALVRALTGTDADRLPEEKARGITIDLGYAYKPLEHGERLGFIDVPGHERFVHNMLAGASGIDFVLLVVAADDGVMPQTVEHVQILDLLGLAHGIVALTKADLVDAARLAEVTNEIRALLAPTVLAGAEILPCSTITGDGVAAIDARLSAAARERGIRSGHSGFRLAIDRVFTLAGAGTIVTGTVFDGHMALNDHLVLTPSGIEARVRAIHAQNAPANAGGIGQRCAVNLTGPGIAKDKIHRGEWLVSPALHRPALRLDVRLRLLASESRPLRHWTPVHVHIGAAHVQGRVALMEGEDLTPGHSALAQLVLDAPVGALFGDRFILRDQSARRTLGGGSVIDPWPPERGRRKPERIAQLQAAQSDDAATALTALCALPGAAVDLQGFAAARNLGPEALKAVMASSKMAEVGGFAATSERIDGWKSLMLETLAGFHKRHAELPGLVADKFRLAMPERLSPALFEALRQSLIAAKRIEVDGPWARLPGHAVALTLPEQRLWARIQPLIRAKPYEPPRTRDFAQSLGAKEDDVRKLLKRLARMGQLVEVETDRFYGRPTVAAMVQMCVALGSSGPFSAAQFRDKIGTGRKLAILILEFFDRSGITLRQGDLRRIRPEKSGLFG